MENYFVDIAILSIIVICALLGRKNGILAGLINLASAVIALICGKIFTPFVAPYVGKIIHPIFSRVISASPEKYIDKYIPLNRMNEFTELALKKGSEVLDLLCDELTFLSQNVIAFFVIFVIMIVVSNVVLKFLSLHFPLIKTINRTLGMLFGAFVGLILVAILFSSITKYIETEQSYITLLPYFENSYFANFFLK